MSNIKFDRRPRQRENGSVGLGKGDTDRRCFEAQMESSTSVDAYGESISKPAKFVEMLKSTGRHRIYDGEGVALSQKARCDPRQKAMLTGARGKK